MARFSLIGGGGGSSEGAGPSRRRRKRLRTTTTPDDPFGVRTRQEDEEDDDVDDNEEESEDEEDDEEEDEEEEEEEEEEGGGEQEQVVIGPQSNGSTVSMGSNDRVESNSVTLTDLEVLDCPICYESLKVPVFQCDSGHVACSSCCTKLENKCPFCCWSIGYIRCRAMEKVLESVKISCQYSQYGCKEKVSYGKKDDHEENCLYEPCLCPLPDCKFLGSFQQMSRHLSTKHSTSAKKFRYSCLFPISFGKNDRFLVLQEESEGSLFILNNTTERLGNAVKVSCVGPRSSSRGFSYDLIAKNAGSSLRLQYVTENISGRVPRGPTGFLLIPPEFFSSPRQLKLDICIRSNCISPTGS